MWLYLAHHLAINQSHFLMLEKIVWGQIENLKYGLYFRFYFFVLNILKGYCCAGFYNDIFLRRDILKCLEVEGQAACNS